MTTASTEGRRLVLTVEGIDDPFVVDPLSAVRGRALTDAFIKGATNQLDPLEVAQIFIESIGPANYARLNGTYVDVFDAEGHHSSRFGPLGRVDVERVVERPEGVSARYIAVDGGDELEGAAPIRQEEGETLCLAAFYWQTVVGMEGVNALLEDAGGTIGSLKALNLLLWKLGVSPSTTSLSGGLEALIQSQADSIGTTTRSGSKTSELVPLARRGFGQAGANRAERRRKRRRG